MAGLNLFETEHVMAMPPSLLNSEPYQRLAFPEPEPGPPIEPVDPKDIWSPVWSLYPFQREAIAELENGFHVIGLRSQRLILPTGCGKTVCFAMFTKRRIEDGKRVLITVHRDDLMRQARQKLSKCGLIPLIEQGDSRALTRFGPENPLVLASIQSLHVERCKMWPRDSFDYIICDEGHHVKLDSHWRKVLQWFYTARRIAVTATPGMMQGKKYVNVAGWQRDVEPISLGNAIRGGYLVPLKFRQVQTGIDLREIGSVAGDFKQNELDQAIYENTNKLATAVKENIGQRMAVIFTPLVKSAEALAKALSDIGIPSRCVSYKTPKLEIEPLYKSHERWPDVIRDGRDPGPEDFQCLVTAIKLTEGYYSPAVECVVLCRPTHSVNLYRQMVGRGTRLSPETGKSDCLVLDFAYVSGTLALAGAPAMLNEEVPEEDADAIANVFKEIMAEGEDVDLVEAMEKAKRTVEERKEAEAARQAMEARKREEEEERRRKHMEQRFRYTVRELDPLATNLLGIPKHIQDRWDDPEPAAAEDLEKIVQWTKGLVDVRGMSRQAARALKAELVKGFKLKLSSYPQRHMLTTKLGNANVAPEVARNMLHDDASAYISAHKTWSDSGKYPVIPLVPASPDVIARLRDSGYTVPSDLPAATAQRLIEIMGDRQ